MIRTPQIALLAALAICSLIGAGYLVSKWMVHKQRIASITEYHPYGPIFPMDPRGIDSVGDQVLSEHIFGFHSRASTREGFAPVLSKIEIDQLQSSIRLTPRPSIMRSDGSVVSPEDICNALRESFRGTSHIPYSSLLKSIRCAGKSVQISLSKVPVNIEFLFTLPDFSIFDKTLLPIQSSRTTVSTGPYFMAGSKDSEVLLERNPFYPSDLVANTVPHVSLRSYSSSDTEQLAARMEVDRDHFAYFFGHVISEKSLNSLKEKGYRLNHYPSEWLIYLGFQPEVLTDDRRTIGGYLDKIREQLLSIAPTGQPAFSISPKGRPWSLPESDYKKIVEHRSKPTSLSQPYTVGTLDHWAGIPYFKALLENLAKKFPSLKVKIYPRNEGSQFYKSCDLFLTPLGISPADPLSHLAFLKSFYRIYQGKLTDELLTRLATEDSPGAFTREVKEIESLIANERLMVPLAHFPGIVAESPLFDKDENLTWSWGIQPWTYRLR